jgi:hypothetical protein
VQPFLQLNSQTTKETKTIDIKIITFNESHSISFSF